MWLNHETNVLKTKENKTSTDIEPEEWISLAWNTEYNQKLIRG